VQNFSDLLQGKHFQIRVEMEGVKMCFLTENWSYLKNGERYGQGYY